MHSQRTKPHRQECLCYQRPAPLLRGNPDPADEILESRVGAPGVVVEGLCVEKDQTCFVLFVGLLQPSERLLFVAQRLKGKRNEKGP